MTTDLFFMPTLPQKPPSALQCDKAGSVSPEPYSKTKSPGPSMGEKQESFLATLRKVSQDRNLSERSRQSASTGAARSEKTDRHPESASTGAARSEKTDRHPQVEQGRDKAPVDDDTLNDIISLLGNDEALLNDESQLAADLNQLIAWLEELGLKGSSGERMLPAGAEGAVENMSNPAEEGQGSLSALKQLIGAIPPAGLKLGNDLLPGLERLRQLIANQLAADPGHGHSAPQENAASINGARAGEGNVAAQPLEMIAAMNRPTRETEAVSKEPASTKAVENSQIPLQPENLEKKEAGTPNRNMQAATETMVPNNRVALATAEGGQRSGGEAPLETSLAGESSPVSKLINDAQAEKDGPLKFEPTLTDDAGSKVVKLEAGTNDSGQLGSQSQTFDKTLDSASAPKETEAAQRELRTQTMEQIVSRAVIQARDGQHEARIDLKPDFMGHVRMQVITENQQVTVKILTEFGFVKDMIENNIQQLKAGLQQQGLEVDKVDVSVSRDANGDKHQQENTEHAKKMHRGDKSSDHGQDQERQQKHPNPSPLRTDGLATVDYFA